MPDDALPPPRRRRPSRATTRDSQGPNVLLAALPARAYAALAPQLVSLSLAAGDELYAPGAAIRHVYFPDSTVLSMLARMDDGTIMEVGTIGREGFAGLPVLIGVDSGTTQCVAQVPGDVRRLSATALRAALAAADGRPLRDVLLRYAYAFMQQLQQASACNALHSVVERCARWLLTTDDTAGRDTAGGDGDASTAFELKQQYLAHLLGVRREGVSSAARTLRAAGLIEFSRGRITVVDRAGLEAASCECYGAVAGEYARVLGVDPRRAR
ncbi:MAG TPA: Crp/Fnr family transcriptional regulator [Gemmatimonadaceae bacterium]|nr:Crp/Fnr family transcriptional regulator [Gemmatimonadaceae bacterium]